MSIQQSDVSASYRPINTAKFLSGDGAGRSPAKPTHKQVWDAAKQQVISVQVADDEAEKLVDPCCSQQNSPIPVGVALLARRDSLTAENQIPAVRWASTAPQQPNTWDEVYESAFETAAFTRTTSGVSRSPGVSITEMQAAVRSLKPLTPFGGSDKKSGPFNGATRGLQLPVGDASNTTASADSALKLLRELQANPEDSSVTGATSSSKAAGRLRAAVKVAVAAAAFSKPAQQLRPATPFTGALLDVDTSKHSPRVSSFAAAALTGVSDEGISSMLASLRSKSSAEVERSPTGRRVVFCDANNSSYSNVQQQEHAPFVRSQSTGILSRSSMRQPMGGAKDNAGDDMFESPSARANKAFCDPQAAQASNGSYQQPSSLLASAASAARRLNAVPQAAPGDFASGSSQGAESALSANGIPRQRTETERQFLRLPTLNRSRTTPL